MRDYSAASRVERLARSLLGMGDRGYRVARDGANGEWAVLEYNGVRTGVHCVGLTEGVAHDVAALMAGVDVHPEIREGESNGRDHVVPRDGA